MSAASPRTELESSWFFTAVDPTAGYNILTSGPSVPTKLRPCRRIVALTAGDLVVTRLDGTSVTIAGLAAGQTLDIQAATIVAAGSTVTSALVCW